MAEYAVTFTRSARRELEALDATAIARILPKIESLVTVPRPHGSRKLSGEKHLWRIRIGDYRVIYSGVRYGPACGYHCHSSPSRSL